VRFFRKGWLMSASLRECFGNYRRENMTFKKEKLKIIIKLNIRLDFITLQKQIIRLGMT